MKSLKAISLATVALFLLTSPASAVDSLDGLLEQTRNARADKEKQNAEREKEFLSSRNLQASMLAEAKQKRDAAEARSKGLSATFDANEIKLAELSDRMDQRVGNLGELFGVVRQVAGDGSAILYNSLLSAQFPGRDEFFADLGKAKELPSIEKLDRLFFEIQREMTESGQVVRFPTEIIDADGKTRKAEVARIGSFIAVSEGQYLSYLPSVGKLSVLARQPGGEVHAYAQELSEATSGHVRAAVDPSRGVLLSMMVQRPNLMERIEKGEAVGYVIIVVGGIAFLLAVYQAIYLAFTRAAVSRQLKQLHRLSSDNPLGRVLASVKTDPANIEADAEVVELRVSEAVLREVPRLERFQPFLRLAVAAGPLLGLVGTVIGMIITFQSITESGSSDPRLMANGIGQAMIATVLGLGIAVPLLFMNAGLATLSRGLVQILDQQSTGLLAEILEKSRGESAEVPEFLQWPIDAVFSLVDEGGPFVIGIYACGLIMWAIVIERYWYFSRVLPKEAKQTIDSWYARSDHRSWCARQIRTAMVSRVNYAMSANVLLLRVLVPLSPLLGLVGTVSGMLEVFDSMAIRGSADARAMASGVSMAMICTLTGLMVSITGLYPVHYFTSRIRRETELLADKLVY